MTEVPIKHYILALYITQNKIKGLKVTRDVIENVDIVCGHGIRADQT